MSNTTDRHPALGMAVALASLLAGPVSKVLFPLMGNAGTMVALIFGLTCAVAGTWLGIRSLINSRQTPSASRWLAGITIAVGCCLSVFSSFILFLMATPNHPF